MTDKNTGARAAALEALLQVSENEGYSNIVIDKTLEKYNLDKRDSALASIIFYGVIEKRITLDYYIAKFLTHPGFKLSNEAREILRQAVYQVLYLEKVPESAAVNEAVNLARLNKVSPEFVNAVLRSFLRGKDKVRLPDENSIEFLSVQYSLPMGLIELWQRSYGKEAAVKILEAFNEKSRMFIRVNSTKTTADELISRFGEDVKAEKIKGLDYACKLTGGGNLTKLKGFEEGLFHVQDLSSQYLCGILAPEENEKIIDVCAAPGGKTFTMAEMMNGTGTVYAYDIYKGRVKLIRSGAYRLGLKNVMASMRDARSGECEISDADRILCDVPCSGFGTIRRKPEIRYKNLEELAALPGVQYDILVQSSKHLKKGGILAYSTCTLNREENGDIADKFLRENPDFEPQTINTGIKKYLDEPENQLTMMPFMGENDGFFVALFKKKL